MSNLIRYITSNDEDELKEEIFQRVVNKSLKEEGGYEYRKNRIEIPTNMGIRQDTLDRFKKNHPNLSSNYPNDVKFLNKNQAMQIYKRDYFEPYKIGDIKHKPLQETMFDSFINHSPKGPAVWAQQAINKNTNIKVDEDGIFGNRTVSALNYIDDEETIKKVNNYILDKRYDDLIKNQKSLGGIFIQRTKGISHRIDRFRIK